MTQDNPTSRSCIARFRTLVAAVAQDAGAELECHGATSILLDDDRVVRMLVELSAPEQCAYAVVPFMRIPPDKAVAASIASKLLGLAAVRAALIGASFGSDAQRGQFCVVRQLGLDLAPADFLHAVQELARLGELARVAVEDLIIAELAAGTGHPQG
jgi:hypothetical protein